MKSKNKELTTLQKKRVCTKFLKNGNKIFQQKLLYEKFDEKIRKDFFYFFFFKVIDIDSNYDYIFLRVFYFGPKIEGNYSPDATYPNTNFEGLLSEFVNTETATENWIISFQSALNCYEINCSSSANTYNQRGFFSKNCQLNMINYEFSDPTSIGNSFIGKLQQKKKKDLNCEEKKKLRKLSSLVNKHGFDNIYKEIWEKNNDL